MGLVGEVQGGSVKVTLEVSDEAANVLKLAADEAEEDLGTYIAKASLMRAMGQLQPGALPAKLKNTLRGKLIGAINKVLEENHDDTD